jgi:predicted transcriptional regulator
MRRRLGLTQSQLARAAGFSQSFVAKVEYGEIDPGYSKAVKLFETLEGYGREKELNARAVMSKRIVSVTPGSSLKEAVRKFREHDISQMPVFEGGHAVGVVSENDVLAAMVEGKHAAAVKEVMEDAPPTVSPEASIKAVSSLLRFCPLVVVAQRGKIVGVVSRADLLEPLYGK